MVKTVAAVIAPSLAASWSTSSESGSDEWDVCHSYSRTPQHHPVPFTPPPRQSRNSRPPPYSATLGTDAMARTYGEARDARARPTREENTACWRRRGIGSGGSPWPAFMATVLLQLKPGTHNYRRPRKGPGRERRPLVTVSYCDSSAGACNPEELKSRPISIQTWHDFEHILVEQESPHSRTGTGSLTCASRFNRLASCDHCKA